MDIKQILTRRHQAGNDRKDERYSVQLRKEGSLCFCVEYQAVNAITVPQSFRQRHVDDNIDLSRKVIIFSTVEAGSGYWQARIYPKNLEQIAFTSQHGLYLEECRLESAMLPLRFKYPRAIYYHPPNGSRPLCIWMI